MSNIRAKLSAAFSQVSFKSLIIFAGIALTAFVAVNWLSPYLASIVTVLLVIELTLVIIITWGLAVHVVIKSLFGVGAGLSLIIFLAQEYCKTPLSFHTADDALKSLVAFGLIYIIVEFCWTLYKEALRRSKTLKEINDGKWPWLILVPFALFTGLFIWQVVQVVRPIVDNLCIYTPAVIEK